MLFFGPFGGIEEVYWFLRGYFYIINGVVMAPNRVIIKKIG